MSIKLDWEVSDVPEDNEKSGARKSNRKHAATEVKHEVITPPPAGPGQPGPTPRLESGPLAWRKWLVWGVILALGVFGLWTVTRTGWRRVSDDIAALVIYEDKLAAQGDTDLVLRVQDQGNSDWLEVRRAEVENQLPAPRPLPMLQQVDQPVVVDHVVALDNEYISADVQREFAAPDGRPFSFVLPQFYRRAGTSDWQRSAPPGNFWGSWLDYSSPHLRIRYSERDQDIVNQIGPRLETWLAQACNLWAERCAQVLPAKLYLSGFVGSLQYNPLANVEVRVEFGQGPGALEPDYFLSVPSPQIAGIPADEAGKQYLSEYLAVRLIASLAQRASQTPSEFEFLTAQAIRALDLGRADPGFAGLVNPHASVVPFLGAVPDKLTQAP